MKATIRFLPSAISPWSVADPSESRSPSLTVWPVLTVGLWWMSVPWLERMNFCSSYSCFLPPPVGATTIRLASTYSTLPGPCESSTSPVSSAARRSMPVPIRGASDLSSGTACRCMFEPISARLASSCSRNGIIAVATDQICSGETSTRSTSLGPTVTYCPACVRHRISEPFRRPLLGSIGVLACAMMRSSSWVASRCTTLSVTTPSLTTR